LAQVCLVEEFDTFLVSLLWSDHTSDTYF